VQTGSAPTYARPALPALALALAPLVLAPQSGLAARRGLAPVALRPGPAWPARPVRRVTPVPGCGGRAMDGSAAVPDAPLPRLLRQRGPHRRRWLPR